MSSRKIVKTPDVYAIPIDSTAIRSTKNALLHVNRETFRFKLHFLLYLSAAGFALPYIVVFARDRVGISATSLGAALTAQMFIIIFTKPMIGYMADYFNRLKVMITVLSIVNGGCLFLLLTIPNHGLLQRTGLSDLDKLSNYIANLKLCEKHKHELHPRTDSTDPTDEVFVLCFSSHTNALGCIEECPETAKPQTEKHSFCDVIVFRNFQPSNVSDCSVECIWDGNSSCHPKNNASSPSECVEQACGSKSSTNAVADCIYYENLNSLCSTEIVGHSNSSDSNEALNDYATYQFWVFTLLYTISSVCGNAIFTLSDTACFETLQKTGGDFGQQRLWGAIGWGVAAPISGFLNDYTGDYLVSWVVMAALLALFLWNISKLDLVKPHFSRNILKDVGVVLKSREFLAFELLVWMNGMGTGMIWYYLIWFLTSIGGSALLCGLSLAVQSALGVIPLMFFSGWIIRKVGHFNVLTMSLGAYFIRFLWYSYLHNPWLVLPVEFLHGISYGLYYATLASYGKMNAKPGTEATTQAVIFSTHEGLGAGMGCVLGGIGFDCMGGHKTFYYASVFAACGIVLSLVASILLDSRTGEMKVTNAHPTHKENGVLKFKKTPVEF